MYSSLGPTIQSLVSSDKLRQALTMAGSMRSTLCALLFRFAIFLVFACRERISASRAASHDALTAADPQTCFRPEPCGSARESATALGPAIRLTVGAAADLQQSTPTRHQDPFVHHIGYPTSCVSVSTLLHALRCFASQGHSSESSQCSAETPWTSADLFHYLGYPTSCVSVPTLLHALRCFASQGHSSESSQCSAETPWTSADLFRYLGYPTSCVSVPTLLHALRCFASQGHSSESSHWSKWNSFDARFRQCGLGSFMLRTVSVLSWFVVSHKNIYSGISVACGALEYLTAPLCRYKGSDDPSWRFAWVRGVTST